MRILVIEDEEDLRDLICFTLESQLMADVSQAGSGNEAIRVLDSSPEFDCIVSDYAMPDGTGEDVYRYLLKRNRKTPFILVSAHATDKYPIFREQPIAGFIPKPNIFKPLVALIRDLNLARGPGPGASYCRIRTSVILKYGLLQQDLYIKLAEGKFVKIFRKGDVFDLTDFERFKAKTVEHLYIKGQDCAQFLDSLSKNVTELLNSEKVPDDAIRVAGSVIEVLADINSKLGFTPEAQNLARASVNLALRSIVGALEAKRTFNISLEEDQSYLSNHSMALAHIACGIASLLGWTSGPTFLKLSLAAFLHDITLGNPEMARLQGVDDLALHGHRFSRAECQDYLAHPEKAAKLAHELKDLPGDVETIIRQHHERPDGTGLYRLDHTQIDPLAAVFIVAHDIVTFYTEKGTGADLLEFVNNLGEVYSRGNFKPVIKAITSSIVHAASSPAA